MLALIFALALSEPAAAAPPPEAPPPPRAEKVSKADQVTCRWITNSNGIAQKFCLTGRDWRLDQIERQRRVDDFQRRALTTQPH